MQNDDQQLHSGPLSKRAREILGAIYGIDSPKRTINMSANEQAASKPNDPLTLIDSNEVDTFSKPAAISVVTEKTEMNEAVNTYLSDLNVANSLNQPDQSTTPQAEVPAKEVIETIQTASQEQEVQIPAKNLTKKSLGLTKLKDLFVRLNEKLSQNKINKKAFSKNRYIRESRGSLLAPLLIASILLIAITGSVTSFNLVFFMPQLRDAQSKVAQIDSLTKSVEDLKLAVPSKHNDLSQSRKRSELVKDLFQDQNSIKTISNRFLGNLERNRVAVTRQFSAFTNTPISDEVPDPPKAPQSEVKSSLDKLRDAGGKIASNEQLAKQLLPAPKTDPKTKPNPKLEVYDPMKAGVHYYYLKLQLDGPYLNYLQARQQLINTVPGAKIESEFVLADTSKSNVEIIVDINLPFYPKPSQGPKP